MPDFHRKHPQIEKECIKSDTNIRTKLAEGEPFAIYKCPRGLVDASSPIIIAGEHVANVFSGQVFLEPPDETTKQFFREQARKFGFDETEYIKAFKEVPIFTEKKFRAGISFLAKLAQSIADRGLTRLRELEAMEVLRESEGKYRLAMAATTDGLWDWKVLSGEVYYSPSWAKMLGELDVAAEYGSWKSRIHLKDKEIVQSTLQDHLKGKTDYWQKEHRLRTKTGEWKWVLGRGRVVERGANGQPLRMVGTMTDISDLKQAEKTLLNQSYFLQKAQEIGQIGTWELDIKNNELLWTDENYKIFGLPIGTKLTYEIFLNCVHPDDREYVDKEWKAALAKKPYDIEHRLLVDGKVKWVREKAELQFNEKDECIRGTGVTQDITGQKQAEKRIKENLKEKEVLLSEIHHRVKNNMQIISSLLKLQSAKIEDKKYVDMFKDSENRIRSMALVHEKLYQSKDFSSIDFKGYVKSIANLLIRNYSVNPDKIKLNTEIEDIPLGLDNAIPCGLIINELISNSLKYAFPKDREGEIKIVLRAINSHEIELTVSDDGIGIPAEIDARETESLGLQLVYILAENQLEGSIELDRESGTAFRIRFRN